MSGRKRKQYVGRLHLGGGKYQWVGRFNTRKERNQAVAEARVGLKTPAASNITVEEFAERFLARIERDRKWSSYGTAVSCLKAFRRDFGDRTLVSITRLEAQDWATTVPAHSVKIVVTLFNAAIDAEIVERNPFRKLGKRSKGRQDEAPPTVAEFDRLLAACSVLKWYAPQMRALMTFAAYSGMRPGELFVLEWGDIDFDTKRIHVSWRLYKGDVDTPKSGEPREIALTRPARDALLSLPTRAEGDLVFRGLRRQRLTQSTLSRLWGKVQAGAGLDHDFYLATKHYCVHYMYAELNLSPRAIQKQMGWTLQSTLKMLKVYGHGDIGALDEIDRAFENNVVALSDASKTQRGA